jgi:hypothetical protein
MLAYFIRRNADGCSVIELHPDNSEEVVQSGLTLIEAEILCAMRIADLPKPAAPQAQPAPSEDGDDPAPPPCVKTRRDIRQLALKF